MRIESRDGTTVQEDDHYMIMHIDGVEEVRAARDGSNRKPNRMLLWQEDTHFDWHIYREETLSNTNSIWIPLHARLEPR